MSQLLQELQERNNRCRIRLGKLLSNRAIRPVTLTHSTESNKQRNAAVFAAFDPLQTCWRFPPGSFRYFDAAQKDGLVTPNEAIFLSRMLLQRAASLSTTYKGRFAPFFQETEVATLLNHIHELDELTNAGLAISGSWLDRLYEACPWPLRPSTHFNFKSLTDITIPDVIGYDATPWLAWIESLDIACLGPSLGLKIPEIVSIIKILNGAAKRDARNAFDKRITLAKKAVIPVFSFGLQGIVFGIFHDVSIDEEGYLLSKLIQFGQTLSDEYALLRLKQFGANFDINRNAADLAKELMLLFSPVQKIIVNKSGSASGYRLVMEHDYWGGYEQLSQSQIDNEVNKTGISLDINSQIHVYVEPINGDMSFDHEFASMRLQSCIGFLELTSRPSPTMTLPLHQVQKLRADLAANSDDNTISIAKLRQYYIASRIEERWLAGEVFINNSHVKEFIQARIGKELKSGYQISSFASEVERLFSRRISIRKSRNGLALSWFSI